MHSWSTSRVIVSSNLLPPPPPFLNRGTLISHPISTVGDGAFADLLRDFPLITTSSFSSDIVKHGIQHFVLTHRFPPSVRARCLPSDKLKLAKQEFAKLEALEIIRRSSSLWSSPLHMVPKGSGWRCCGAYRQLNSVTTPDKYPVPLNQDFAENLAGAELFLKN